MAKWGVKAQKVNAANNVQGVLYLNAAAASPRRLKLISWDLGSSDIPLSESAFTHTIQRCTTAPTGTALTPNSLDPADTLACTIVATHQVTADGTLTANAFLDAIPLNQRATMRWVARDGCEVITPAVANNGIMLGIDAATLVGFRYGAMFEEQ
jgi:hypothetical protein